MQGIMGIDVRLVRSGIRETVANVLVGEPRSEAGKLVYTLAVPKGDTHVWTDMFVEFWGMTFRTIGFPTQGIEENIPLSWNKKVTVESAPVSGSITVYSKNELSRHVFHGVYFYDSRGERDEKTGSQTAGDVNIVIYSASVRTDVYVPKIGDIVVLDEVTFEFDTSTQQTIAEGLKELRGKYDMLTVKTVENKLNAQHYDHYITIR